MIGPFTSDERCILIPNEVLSTPDIIGVRGIGGARMIAHSV